VGSKLTQQQEIFVQELIKCKSQREAYKIAYPKSKYWKDNTIDARACKLFNSYKVNTRYNELRERLTKYLEDEAIITAGEVIKRIADIARDDIKNYLSFKTVKTVVEHDQDGEPVIGYEMIVEIKDSDDIDTSNISEISLDKNGTFKFKLYARDKALYKLAEIFGLNEIQIAKQKLAEDRFIEEKNIHSKKYW
jgi:phage terminase small subunit